MFEVLTILEAICANACKIEGVTNANSINEEPTTCRITAIPNWKLNLSEPYPANACKPPNFRFTSGKTKIQQWTGTRMGARTSAPVSKRELDFEQELEVDKKGRERGAGPKTGGALVPNGS
jgi:hypothetical protein